MAGLNTNVSGRIGDGAAQVFGNKTMDTATRLSAVNEQRDFNKIQDLQKEKAQALQDINLTLDGIDKDINGELTQGKAYLQEYARKVLKEEGLNDDSFAKISEAKSGLANLITKSQDQKAYLKQNLRQLQYKTADKYFDIEQSKQNIEEWKNMSIAERANYDKELLVSKEEKYNQYDIPEDMFSGDYKPNDKWKGRFYEMIGTPGTPYQKWYEGGMGKLWSNPEEANAFFEIENDAKYKDRAPSVYNQRLRFNEAGDPSIATASEDYYRPGNTPIFYGTENAKMRNVYKIPEQANSQENYNTSFKIQGKEGWDNGTLNGITPIMYMTDPDGRDILQGYKTVSVEVPPSVPQVNAFMMTDKAISGGYTKEQAIKELTKTQREGQYYFIDITEDSDNQSKLRPNLWNAYQRRKSKERFEAAPVSQQASDFLDYDYNQTDSSTTSPTPKLTFP